MTDNELYELALSLRNLLISRATGGAGEDSDYIAMRKSLMNSPRTRELLPSFVKTTFDLNSFWGFIKSKFDNYAERRTFINNTGRGFLTRTAGFLVNRFAPQS